MPKEDAYSSVYLVSTHLEFCILRFALTPSCIVISLIKGYTVVLTTFEFPSYIFVVCVSHTLNVCVPYLTINITNICASKDLNSLDTYRFKVSQKYEQ